MDEWSENIALSAVKLSLRINHNLLDEDIKRNIYDCLLDMERVGVSKTGETASFEYPIHGLRLKAIELYCKWVYDFNGKGEQFLAHYEKLRDALSLSREC